MSKLSHVPPAEVLKPGVKKPKHSGSALQYPATIAALEKFDAEEPIRDQIFNEATTSAEISAAFDLSEAAEQEVVAAFAQDTSGRYTYQECQCMGIHRIRNVVDVAYRHQSLRK